MVVGSLQRQNKVRLLPAFRRGVEISQLPKLKIKVFGSTGEDVCKLEEARSLLNFKGGLILVEGKKVRSYDELVRVAAQENFKNKEFIEVVLLRILSGG